MLFVNSPLQSVAPRRQGIVVMTAHPHAAAQPSRPLSARCVPDGLLETPRGGGSSTAQADVLLRVLSRPTRGIAHVAGIGGSSDAVRNDHTVMHLESLGSSLLGSQLSTA